MLRPIMEKVREAEREKMEKKQKSGYWACCPSCGKSVVKKEFLKKGCFVCGSRDEGDASRVPSPYKTRCPRCSRHVVQEAMERSGCYVCGFHPYIHGGNP